ncbi:hypothetical protein RHGRI_015070 [Rhododendron griersonianum]|uniref:Uncharacterized protein n=1 Tax=Rhododendron griersonianum TaxID=479676 RepID=A0AAV6KCE0_9ERIC|nr:hypothetical protein RHGRI_015070 [Rhododendron griersonianum]
MLKLGFGQRHHTPPPTPLSFLSLSVSQTPVALLHPLSILATKQSQQNACPLKRVRPKVRRLEPGRTHPDPTLTQHLKPLHPVCPLARHHVANLPPQVHLRHHHILAVCLSQPGPLQ